ncbi:MAG: SDR family NAD(P)-dependent oxidoreductase [Salinisphaera sp.]|jgi:NAD(P)-dependent dehydrogenase (short-subunit alcohol dehydrogenase family)|nr:SDR family NAD(P)-dependent oxidoreductase [Salinisphaera sp.]
MQDSRRFTGRCALITGGGGDIGLATAARLAADGADIALLDMDSAKLEAARDKLADSGVRVGTFVCDVTDHAAVDRIVGEIESKFAPIDLLFNNAGFQGAFSPVHTYPANDFRQVMEVNVIGAFHVLQRVAAAMVERGFGRIVNTASMAGIGGPPNMAAYGASKFAIVGLTQTAAKDLAPHGIRVNAISPGFIGPGFMWDRQVEKQAAAGSQYYDADTARVAEQMISSVPMRRYGDLSEIPGAVSFLMSDDASYMTGVNLPISGGG